MQGSQILPMLFDKKEPKAHLLYAVYALTVLHNLSHTAHRNRKIQNVYMSFTTHLISIRYNHDIIIIVYFIEKV